MPGANPPPLPTTRIRRALESIFFIYGELSHFILPANIGVAVFSAVPGKILSPGSLRDTLGD